VIDMRARLKSRVAAALLLVALGSATALAGDPNPVPSVPKGDPAMSAAFARAAATLDDFFAKWRNPPAGADRFLVKIGLADSDVPPGYVVIRPGAAGPGSPVEWFWAGDLHAEGAGFSAQLGNDADDLHNVEFGQVVHFAREEIGDWMYFQNGKIVGNATACPALAHASAEERREMKEQYGLACE
jgi:uncharacterized protein YegJ (DUF2314 family)